jgi:hypothetical protein
MRVMRFAHGMFGRVIALGLAVSGVAARGPNPEAPEVASTPKAVREAKCISVRQVQQVIDQHRDALQRNCWVEQSASLKLAERFAPSSARPASSAARSRVSARCTRRPSKTPSGRALKSRQNPARSPRQ